VIHAARISRHLLQYAIACCLLGVAALAAAQTTTRDEAAAAARSAELQKRTEALTAGRYKIIALLKADTAAFVKAYEEYIAAEEALVREYGDLQSATGLKQKVGSEYLAIGDVVRFRLKQTGRALELYRAAERYGGFGTFAIADLQQFDLGDKAAALSTLRRLVDPPGAPVSDNDTEAFIQRFSRAWLAHQIAYLSDGRKFSGTLDMQDCSGGAIIMAYGMGNNEFNELGLAQFMPLYQYAEQGKAPHDDSVRLAAAFADLPSSNLVLMRTAMFVGIFPDAPSILRYLARNDPAGYSSACFFAVLTRTTNPAVIEAAKEFNRANHVASTQPDLRRATPQKTWDLLVSSLRAGDTRTALDCYTPGMASNLRTLFERMSKEDLRKMADAFSPLALDPSGSHGYWTGYVTNNGHAGVVTFVQSLDEWKIESM
jgi:hypothetical protein